MSENDARRWGLVAREISKAGYSVLWCHGCWRIVRAKKRGFGLKCSAPRRKRAHKLTCLASVANQSAKRPIRSPDEEAPPAPDRQCPAPVDYSQIERENVGEDEPADTGS